jgi:TadE-like protein
MEGTNPLAVRENLGTGPCIEPFRLLNGERVSPIEGSNKERGATAVEFSIIAGLFFAVILGTLDFSMSMFDLNGANFGTRAQARSASNGEWSSTTTCDLTLASGLLGSDERALLCGAKSKTQISPERIRVRVRFEDPDYPEHENVKPQVGKSLVMCTMTTMRSISGVYAPLLKGKVLTSIARSRIERDLSTKWTTAGSTDERGPLSADTISEEPFAGSNWDFCEDKSIGNTEVGVDTVAPSNEFCKVTWTSGQDADPRHYRLDGTVTNLSRNPWNDYQVTFTLPAGHTPRSRTYEEGVMSSDLPIVDNGLVTWTFEKVAFVPVGGTKVFGIPLADGDISPGNGVSLTVTIEPSVAVPSIPVMDGLTKVGVPVDDPAIPFVPSDPFASVEYKGCSD